MHDPAGKNEVAYRHPDGPPLAGQTSLKEMNPDLPIYLFDEGTQPLPSLFYPLLNRCLAVSLLPEWSEYLWVCGRERELITLLDKGEGQGYAAWKVKPDSESWEQMVSEELHQRRLTFGSEPGISEQPRAVVMAQKGGRIGGTSIWFRWKSLSIRTHSF